MSGFYESLRDDTAGPLVKQFGQPGVYRQSAAVYDNALGKVVDNVDTDVATSLLELPARTVGSQQSPQWSAEIMAKLSFLLLVAADALAVAGVVPKTGDHVIYAGKTGRVLAITPIGPAGVVVVYKMGIQVG